MDFSRQQEYFCERCTRSFGSECPFVKASKLKPNKYANFSKFIKCLGEIAVIISMEITLTAMRKIKVCHCVAFLPFVKIQAKA